MALSKALVVDDSRLARVALSKLLGRRGLEVDLAGSGGEALEYLRGEAPDVVFLDYMMPDMDGFEAARAIQAMPGHEPLPLVMYTSQDTDSDRERARELGICGFLSKPTSEDGLEAVLRDVEAWSPSTAEPVTPVVAPTSQEAVDPPVAASAADKPAGGGMPAASMPDAQAIERCAREAAEAVALDTLGPQLDEARAHWQLELERVDAELRDTLRQGLEEVRAAGDVDEHLRSELDAGLTRCRDDAMAAARAAAEQSACEAMEQAAASIRGQAEQAGRQAAEHAVGATLARQQPSAQDPAAIAEQVDAIVVQRLDSLLGTDAFREQLTAAVTHQGVPALKDALSQWVRERAAEAAAAAAQTAVEETLVAHGRLRRLMLLGGAVLAVGVLAALLIAV